MLPYLAEAYLKRSVKWTWTGSAFSTNESAWRVMVTGTQSRVCERPLLPWSLKRSVKRTWTGSAYSTNESGWSVMVTGSQSRFCEVALTPLVPQGECAANLDQLRLFHQWESWKCIGRGSSVSCTKWLWKEATDSWSRIISYIRWFNEYTFVGEKSIFSNADQLHRLHTLQHKVSSKEAATLGSPHSRIASFPATLDRVIATIWLTNLDVEVKNKPKAIVLLYSQILIPALSSHRTPKVATAQSGMRLSHYLEGGKYRCLYHSQLVPLT